jgi:inosine-uridine nucleoside N-ribohydrolase
MRKLWSLIALLGLACQAQAATVWIDTDVSIGSPFREVDDAYALVLAFHSPEIRIAGVSATYGNAPLGHTTRVAREMVQRFGPRDGLSSNGVFAGAGAARDLGRRSDASDALAAVLEKQRVTYIALGPLTNLATFLQLHPKSASRIERVVFLGGQAEGSSLAFGPTRSFHIHDANVFKDPAATAVVLRSKIPLTLVPIAIASDLLIDASDLRKLEQSGEAGSYLSRRSRTWLWFWTHFAKTKGGPIFDALALTATAKPELLGLERRYARMDQAGNLVVTKRLTNGARPVRFCFGFAPRAKGFVMKRLLAQRAK